MGNVQIKVDRNPYEFHPLLVLRTPRLGLYDKMVLDETFLESIYLASPIVYEETLKWQANGGKEKATEKLHQTLLKYHLRSSSRCTPFGLFASCSVIPWASETNKITIGTNKMERYVRLDMDYLFMLTKKLLNTDKVRENLLFYSNNSIYQIGDELRFVECIVNNNLRQYQISSIKNTEAFELVVKAAKQGTKLSKILKLLMEEYPLEEAEIFINELIDAQILVSELQPQLTGSDYLKQIICSLEKMPDTNNMSLKLYLQTLKDVQEILERIRNQQDGHMASYLEISSLLKTLDIPIIEVKLFQVDVFNKVENGSLGVELKKQLTEILIVLNKLAAKPLASGIEQFCKDYGIRYGEREMPLLHVLDPEIGIGYLSGNDVYPAPLIEGLNINKNKRETSINWTKTEEFLLKKLLENQGEPFIEINENDLEQMEADWKDTPLSLSIIFKILDISKSIVQIESVGGSSASNLLGRFAHISSEIKDIVHDVANWEAQNEKGKVIAEIVHQPESRICNIMTRPASRLFEIPYLAQSSLSNEYQIGADDLLVSVKNNKVFLRSKKNGKEVLPRLGNAHNFTKNDLAVYRFLCDLQTQGERRSFRFDWGNLQKIYKRLPRVTYKNNILSPARWSFTKEDLSCLFSKQGESPQTKLDEFRQQNGIPQYVFLSEADNDLAIDFSSQMSIDIFFGAIKGKNPILLKEKIKTISSGVCNTAGNQFANEFICSMLKKTEKQIYVEYRESISNEPNTIKRDFIFGSEWAYYKIYCGVKSADKILLEVIRPLTKELLGLGVIDKWFFIRYNDPEFHLRLRFHLAVPLKITDLIQSINRHMENYLESGHIWNMQTEIYARELERYGAPNIEFTESLFYIDSTSFLDMVVKADEQNLEEIRWIYLLKAIDNILECFGFNLDKKECLFYDLVASFGKEHNLDKKLNFELDTSYRKFKKVVWQALDQQNLGLDIEEIINTSNGYNTLIIPIAKKLIMQIDKEKLCTYLKNMVHMMANRVFMIEKRLHELVIYHFLHQYYKSKIVLRSNAK